MAFEPSHSPQGRGRAHRTGAHESWLATSALFRDGEGWAAFVVEHGRARKRPVVSPRRGAREATVESGLADGETVILYPTDAIADGTAVTVR